MPGKTLKTRIQNKVDTLSNFQLNNPYILSGELATAYQTMQVQNDDGTIETKRVGYIYVGPGWFNDLVPIVGPASDVKLWAKVDNFVDVVIEKFVQNDKTGDIANDDTVNDMISRINNNFQDIRDSIDSIEIPTKTSDLVNDGEGADLPTKDFLTDYEGHQFVSRDSIKQYIRALDVGDVASIQEALKELQDAIDQINEDFNNYYTKVEIDNFLKDYLQQIQIGDKDGGVILSSASTAISSTALWDQIKDSSKKDIEDIADAAASTALQQANDYTDNKLSEFITISYKGPYNSYAGMVADNPTGKAGIIYLVRHDHNDSDNYDPTDSDIFDEYIWVQNDELTGSYEKVGNTDVKLTDYLQALIVEDRTGVIENDDAAVAKVEIVEEPAGSGDKVFKVTYKTIVKQETFESGRVAVGFQDGALKSSALVNIPLAGIASSSTSTIGSTTTLGSAIREIEGKIVDAAESGVQSVDIATQGGLDVSGGPITSAGTLIVSHSERSTATSAIASTVGASDTRSYIKNIGLDKYGHVVAIETDSEQNKDSYLTSATFSTAKASIQVNFEGTGDNFKNFSATLSALPAMMLTQTDDPDDFLVFYCGDSTELVQQV